MKNFFNRPMILVTLAIQFFSMDVSLAGGSHGPQVIPPPTPPPPQLFSSLSPAEQERLRQLNLNQIPSGTLLRLEEDLVIPAFRNTQWVGNQGCAIGIPQGVLQADRRLLRFTEIRVLRGQILSMVIHPQSYGLDGGPFYLETLLDVQVGRDTFLIVCGPTNSEGLSHRRAERTFGTFLQRIAPGISILAVPGTTIY